LFTAVHVLEQQGELGNMLLLLLLPVQQVLAE
jgi:hypothetical protein